MADVLLSLGRDTAFWNDVAAAADRSVTAKYEPDEGIACVEALETYRETAAR